MGTGTNKAQVLYGPRDLRLTQRHIEGPGPDEVQIAIKATTLCGSDLHYFAHYANGDLKIKEPLTQGHESAGSVIAVGADVKDLKVGDRVALEVGVPCEICEHCKDGNYNVCPEMSFRSSAASFPHFQGTLQERLNHPAKWCHRLPESISFSEGALLEPLAVAVHAVQRAQVKTGSTCLVIGAGAVGLLCAAVARYQGCEYVVMTDIAKNRLDFALANGFADAIHTITPTRGASMQEDLEIAKGVAKDIVAINDTTRSRSSLFNYVFECTGVQSSVQVSIYSCRARGKVLLVGMGTPILTLPISAAAFREIDLVGIWRYANAYPTALKIMASAGSESHVPDIRKLITHTFQGLESVPNAFDTAFRTVDRDDKLIIKVVVQC